MINPLFPIDNLAGKLTSKCPICGNDKGTIEMTVIEERDDSHLVYIQCKKCFSNLIGFVNFGQMGVSVISFATDLEKSEIIKFKNAKNVDEDDILELHEALENEKINFIEIIKYPK